MTSNLLQLQNQYAQIFYEFSPVSATGDGYEGLDGKLTTYGVETIENTKQKISSLETEVQKYAPVDKNETIDRELLLKCLELFRFDLEVERGFESDPDSIISEASESLFSLMISSTRSDAEKSEYLVKRLEALPLFLTQSQSTLTQPVKLWTEMALDEIPGFREYLDDTIIPFLEKQQAPNTTSLQKNIHDALDAYALFLKNHSSIQESIALGATYFDYLLKTDHGITDDWKTLKDLGLQQMDLIKNQLAELTQKIDPQKNWQELVDQLKKNCPTEKNLLQTYIDSVNQTKKFLIEKDLVTLPPEETLKIMETPSFLQESIPFAAYSGPAMFGKEVQGIFYVSPPHGDEEVLQEHCLASLPLTALHEGYPGHHLQFSIQRNLNSPVRKMFDVSSYYEGWTLYCEEMMYREGFYTEAMRLFQLKDKLWRACRIIVDIGMHCENMSAETAAQFLVDHAKLSPEGARVDVNWYTQSPTIPMSYLIGMLEVDRIRTEFLKPGKTLKEFHNAFLGCGAIPLSFVRKIIL